ncbi:MAG: YfhO family protein [Patescibacteria group bacterium]
MKHKDMFIGTLISIILVCILFYKSIFYGAIPFPGDSLLSHFKPWQVTSYDGYGAGGIPNKAQYPDVIRQMYPWRIEAVRQWKEGNVPLWNPYSFSGTPLLANFQSASLYPLNILFFIFSENIAWTLLVALQPFLAILFTYLYLRRLKTSTLASVFGAVSYGVSGFMTVWLEYNTVGHVMAWLPLALYAIELFFIDTKIKIAIPLLTLSVALSLLSGHPQVALYAIIFIFSYAMLRLQGKNKFYALLAFLIGFGLAAVQLVSGIELIAVAARANHSYEQMMKTILIQPWQILMTFFPNLYGNPVSRTYWPSDTYVGKVTSIGLVPLFFLLSSLRLHKIILVRFYIIAVCMLGIFITVNPLTKLLYKFSIPLISSSSPTLMIFIFSFCLAVLTSFGIDGWIKETHSIKKLFFRALQVSMGIGLMAFSFMLLPSLKIHAPIALRALLYGFSIASVTVFLFYIAVRHKNWMIPALWILLILHVFDLSYAFFKFNPFVPASYMYPNHAISERLTNQKTPTRFWGYGTAAIDANIPMLWRAYSPNGYDPLYPKWYGEFIGASKDGKLIRSFDNDNRSDATIASGFGENDFQNNIYRKQILRSLSVTQIIDREENGTSEKTFPPKTYALTTVSDWRVFTDLDAPSIVRIATKSSVASTKEEFEHIFFAPNFNPVTDVIVDDSQLPTLNGTGNVEITSYTSSTIEVITHTKGTSMLVVANTYYKGWTAYVDNKPTPLYRVNWTMNGVLLPEGDHTITLRYEPTSYRIGLWISALSLSVFIAIVIFKKTNNKS